MNATSSFLILNGSVGGDSGNSARLIDRFTEELRRHRPATPVEVLALETTPTESVLKRLVGASGVVFVTGTYWDSWGSPLQRFLEQATAAEGTDAWLGKPAAVLVTAHSVGAKGVLSRLQGVLNTLGCLIPPMSGWAYTAASQQALACECKREEASYRDDFWCPEDLPVIAHNLVTAIESRRDYRCWPVDRKDPGGVWMS